MQPSTIESEISKHFHNAGAHYSAESALLGTLIHKIAAQGKRITNKVIILHLIAELDATTDPTAQNLLRNTLEIVVGNTPDDGGF